MSRFLVIFRAQLQVITKKHQVIFATSRRKKHITIEYHEEKVKIKEVGKREIMLNKWKIRGKQGGNKMENN